MSDAEIVTALRNTQSRSKRQLLDAAADAIERLTTSVECRIYDKEEVYDNCTVQVLTNTVTGEVSIGWWENEEADS